jgi:Zn-finger nucleic acid-binding protein
MDCPKCKTNQLSDAVKISDLIIPQCSRCHGLWFGKDELRKAKDEKIEDANWFDIDLWREKTKFHGKEGKKSCPQCGLFLWELSYGDSGIRIDVCKKCEGIWLDRGEFEKILKFVKDKSDHEILYSYLHNLIEEGKEIFVGPESFRSEFADFLMLLKLFKYKFAAQHQTLSKILENIPKNIPY